MRLIFVIGRPGSGKTTFIGLFKTQVKKILNADLPIFNDRDVLLSFAREGSYPDLIQPIDHINFTVLDQRVFDVATAAIVAEAAAADSTESPFAVVEFSRQNYLATFAIVASVINDYELIVHLAAPLDVCIERNMQRTSHVVPEAEMRKYFDTDDIEMLREREGERVLALSNNSTLAVLEEHASLVMTRLLERLGRD